MSWELVSPAFIGYCRRPKTKSPEEVAIQFNRKRNDLNLTVQMGSSGAAIYTQSVIYSLATLENVDCVYFDIREGNHAGPGKHRPLGD